MYTPRFIIVVFLIVTFFFSRAQEIEVRQQAVALAGKGSINNTWQFTISIEFLPRVEYKDGCVSRMYSQVIGQYKYQGKSNNISLIGERTDWMNNDDIPDSIKIYELDSDFTPSGLFRGKLSAKSFSGTWQNLKTLQRYPMQINFSSPSHFGTLEIFSGSGQLVLPNISNTYGQGRYTVIHNNLINGSRVIILETQEPCCAFFNCRGAGCGGSNDYLYLFVASETETKSNKQLISSSCEEQAVVERKKSNQFYSVITENSTEKYSLTIDLTNIGVGIVKEKL